MVCTEVGTATSFVNVDGETGLVVPPRDPAALSAALRRLLADEPLRRRLGEAARRRAHERFTFDATLREVTAVYEGILGRRSRVDG